MFLIPVYGWQYLAGTKSKPMDRTSGIILTARMWNVFDPMRGLGNQDSHDVFFVPLEFKSLIGIFQQPLAVVAILVLFSPLILLSAARTRIGALSIVHKIKGARTRTPDESARRRSGPLKPLRLGQA